MFDRELWRTPISSLSDERIAKIGWVVGYSHVFIVEKLAVVAGDGWQDQALPDAPDEGASFVAIAEAGRDRLRCSLAEAVEFAEREARADRRVIVGRIVEDIPWY
jgi:hypothetical protein